MVVTRVRPVRGCEGFVPERLSAFLMELEATQTSEDVWALMVAFAEALDCPIVDYVCATDYRNWQKTQFIRTTYHSRWIEEARNNPNVRKTSYFRSHAIHYLTPIVVGTEYLAELGPVSAERLAIMEFTREMGLSAGLAVPLRMAEPGQAAIMTVGGLHSRAAFDAILAEHGWSLHAAILSAHTRYIELFKAEFVERNALTERQKEMITLVGHGLLDKQIAARLGISHSAVRQRIVAVQQKTGMANRVEIAALAMRIGLVPDPTLKPHEADLTVFLSTGDGKSGSETEHHHARAAE